MSTSTSLPSSNPSAGDRYARAIPTPSTGENVPLVTSPAARPSAETRWCGARDVPAVACPEAEQPARQPLLALADERVSTDEVALVERRPPSRAPPRAWSGPGRGPGRTAGSPSRAGARRGRRARTARCRRPHPPRRSRARAPPRSPRPRTARTRAPPCSRSGRAPPRSPSARPCGIRGTRARRPRPQRADDRAERGPWTPRNTHPSWSSTSSRRADRADHLVGVRRVRDDEPALLAEAVDEQVLLDASASFSTRWYWARPTPTRARSFVSSPWSASNAPGPRRRACRGGSGRTGRRARGRPGARRARPRTRSASATAERPSFAPSRGAGTRADRAGRHRRPRRASYVRRFAAVSRPRRPRERPSRGRGSMVARMTDAYDVLVIGAGTGGYSCALRAAQLGKRVASWSATSASAAPVCCADASRPRRCSSRPP